MFRIPFPVHFISANEIELKRKLELAAISSPSEARIGIAAVNYALVGYSFHECLEIKPNQIQTESLFWFS